MRNTILLVAALSLVACQQHKETADLLVTNANIYTVNDNFDTAESFAVKDGLIVAIDSEESLEATYDFAQIYDAGGKSIFPGLIDAHAHLYNLGVGMQQVDLVGTTGAEDVIQKVSSFQAEKQMSFIQGRGWDQNDWDVKEFPTKEMLDAVFPDTPVALRRIDGHALWVNSKALEMSGITADTKMPGGEVVLKDGEPSGILVDAPMSLVGAIIPPLSRELQTEALLEAADRCMELGLTTVNDAGLSREVIELIDSLQQSNLLKLRVYAMVSNYPDNLDHFLSKGKIKTPRLNVRSVKVYGDGALGSRGAAMRSPYSDQDGHYGAMITDQETLTALAKRIAYAGYQMNTHAIGDSANIAVMRAYTEALKGKEDARWKIEHAQIVTPADFDYFSLNIIPSVQPTHATSDMYWAEDRVGSERIKGAYAFKTLLNKAGIVALGTDFPVERVNPMHTFYAAVARKDLQQYPEGGFRMEEALSREETIKGMTIWAAYSNFEETEKGSIEVGKMADFVVLDGDLMQMAEDQIPNTKVLATFIGGEAVYKGL
ncbi:amidohydrolase [Aureitalea marina]|uniref:Amidohydrolase n=2 Tax=Aureitalea marina TaxID=930804 RepID=A0A2S7KTP3_9FLAO|nr:amidohydrolase [Aureitalea marina]